LLSIKEISFKGLIYTDYAVFTTALALGLTQSLYYDGDMLATNSYTASNLNDELVFVSKELYYEEIEEIATKVSGDVVVQVQGLIGMFHSMRPLVSNYKDYLSASFDEKSEQNSLYDEERDLYYPILETDDGSFIMGGKEIALIDQLDLLSEIKVGMLKIDGFMQSDEYVLEMSKTYLNALNELTQDLSAYKANKSKYIKKVEEIGSRPIDKGFFFKPTLYKVKK
jgi:putative protease